MAWFELTQQELGGRNQNQMRSHPSFLEGGTYKTKQHPFCIAIIYVCTALTVHLSIISTDVFEGGKIITPKRALLEVCWRSLWK